MTAYTNLYFDDCNVQMYFPQDGESRVVKQFHYTTWPDHGVPKFSSSLLLLRQKIRAHDRLDMGPPVIHCRYVTLTLCVYFMI